MKKNLDYFQKCCEACGLPVPEREYKFHPTREWKLDYCWPKNDYGFPMTDKRNDRLGVEVQGGIWQKNKKGEYSGTGHSHPMWIMRDIEKHNALTMQHIFLLQCTPADVRSGVIFTLLKKWFGIL
jgi:hypothetical protein